MVSNHIKLPGQLICPLPVHGCPFSCWSTGLHCTTFPLHWNKSSGFLAEKIRYYFSTVSTEGSFLTPSSLRWKTMAANSLIFMLILARVCRQSRNICRGLSMGTGSLLKVCLRYLIPGSQERQPKSPPGSLMTNILSSKPGLHKTLCPMLYPMWTQPWESSS